jgi:hypothetical protein
MRRATAKKFFISCITWDVENMENIILTFSHNLEFMFLLHLSFIL